MFRIFFFLYNSSHEHKNVCLLNNILECLNRLFYQHYVYFPLDVLLNCIFLNLVVVRSLTTPDDRITSAEGVSGAEKVRILQVVKDHRTIDELQYNRV